MNPASFGSGLPLIVDTSAWNRQDEASAHGRWKATARARLLVGYPKAALEILAGAHDKREFKIVEGALAALPQAPITASACRAALGACRELGGRHRIPAADYLIAAAAAEREFDVLHIDKHFDLLAEVLGLESARVAGGNGCGTVAHR